MTPSWVGLRGLNTNFMMEVQVQLEPRHLLLEVMVNQGIIRHSSGEARRLVRLLPEVFVNHFLPIFRLYCLSGSYSTLGEHEQAQSSSRYLLKWHHTLIILSIFLSKCYL